MLSTATRQVIDGTFILGRSFYYCNDRNGPVYCRARTLNNNRCVLKFAANEELMEKQKKEVVINLVISTSEG